MSRVVATLLVLLLAGCAAGGGVSGPYMGGSGGTNLRQDDRLR
ncbi:MAG: hypothetical protein JWP04_4151 [Belnapia sp.]|nr:hypothetical protein [Belnapia sp.]